MNNCLIGYTGLVGSNIDRQATFQYKYNSKNISQIRGKKFDLIICSGISSLKWKANKHPDEDLRNITILIDALRDISAKKFVLVSTVDVYRTPNNVNEDTAIFTEGLHPYGTHRRRMENFVMERFPDSHIIRFPHLFGDGLKKNVIFDFLHNNELEKIHSEDTLQFYYLDTLYHDIDKVIKNQIRVINFATEPISVTKMAKYAFNREFENKTEREPIKYDMKTKYAKIFCSDTNYIQQNDQVLKDIKNFVNNYDLNSV